VSSDTLRRNCGFAQVSAGLPRPRPERFRGVYRTRGDVALGAARRFRHSTNAPERLVDDIADTAQPPYASASIPTVAIHSAANRPDREQASATPGPAFSWQIWSHFARPRMPGSGARACVVDTI
jgi:hypothetical protein